MSYSHRLYRKTPQARAAITRLGHKVSYWYSTNRHYVVCLRRKS